MTYDPRQSFAAQQLAYSRAAGTQTSKQQGLSKGRGTPISKSRSLGAFEPDPAQRNTTTRSTYTPPRRDRNKNRGSTYDEVPQVLTQGIVQRPGQKPTKETGYERVTRIFNEAMSGFGDFEVPTQPTFDTVKPQNLYKDKRYFGPQVYVPDTSQFGRGYEKKYFLGMELPTGSPKIPRSLKRSNVNIFGNTKDHPRLDMFGVRRRYTRNPDALMAPPSVKMPAKLDPISRALSLAFLPPSMPTTAEYTVSEGESLLTVLDTLNAGKPNSQKVTLEEIGNLNNIPDVVANPFGKIKKGDVLQVPIKKQTAVGDLRDQIEKERSVKRAIIEFERLPESEKKNIRERYRLRKEAQPASYTEEENKILKELEGLDPDVANYVREFYDNQSEERLQKLAEEVGVDIKGKEVQESAPVSKGLGSFQAIKTGMNEAEVYQVEGPSFNKIKKDFVEGYLAGHEGINPHKSFEGGKDTAAYGIKRSYDLDRSNYKTDKDFAAAVALRHYNETKNDFLNSGIEGAVVWNELGEAGRYALTDLHFNTGTVGSSAEDANAKDAITNTLNYIGMLTKDKKTKGSLFSLAKRRAENWNRAADDLGLTKIDKIQQIPRAGGGTIMNYLDSEGNVVHRVINRRKPIKIIDEDGNYKILTTTREEEI